MTYVCSFTKELSDRVAKLKHVHVFRSYCDMLWNNGHTV